MRKGGRREGEKRAEGWREGKGREGEEGRRSTKEGGVDTSSPSLPLSVTLVTRFLLENPGPEGLCLKFLFPTCTGEYAFISCLTWKSSLRRGKFKCNSRCTENAQDVSLQGSRVVLDQSETDIP